MNEQERFSELFTNVLVNSAIEFAHGDDGDAYVVYNENGILFSVTFYRYTKKYVFQSHYPLKSEYKKYELSPDTSPNPRMVYETVDFAYRIRLLVRKAKHNVEFLFNEILFNSDIEFKKRGDFEIYTIINAGMPGYDIAYNQNTKQYGFKRHELMHTLYKVCGIPTDNKPDYAKLYKKAKDSYLAQVALENAQYIYDI